MIGMILHITGFMFIFLGILLLTLMVIALAQVVKANAEDMNEHLANMKVNQKKTFKGRCFRCNASEEQFNFCEASNGWKCDSCNYMTCLTFYEGNESG